jgi:mannose/fructose/N-acetylgalactosamine-specific phosphotransferase system component IIC
MVDKVAVPFWLCLMAGMLTGLDTGDMALWLLIGAAVGIISGLLLASAAMRRRKQAFSRN